MLDNFEHGKLDQNRKLISQHKYSCMIVSVQLLTHLQGACTALAKRESIFLDYILLGLINFNNAFMPRNPIIL
jgi:hypothetical protein